MQKNDSQINVLVTRPSHQSSGLCNLLSHEGFRPIRFPTIEIAPTPTPLPSLNKLQTCGDKDYVIFISPNAVTQADKLLSAQWPALKTIVAMGPKTAQTLTDVGQHPSIIAGKPYSSESLLDAFPHKLNNQSCLIVKGKGGQTTLSDELRKRDMFVDSVNVYKRNMPAHNLNNPTETLHYITITSQLALENLFAMLPELSCKLKQESTFVVLSQRIANYAKQIGCQHISTSTEASEIGLVSAIKNSTKQLSF